jgi:hypothetical protein
MKSTCDEQTMSVLIVETSRCQGNDPFNVICGCDAQRDHLMDLESLVTDACCEDVTHVKLQCMFATITSMESSTLEQECFSCCFGLYMCSGARKRTSTNNVCYSYTVRQIRKLKRRLIGMIMEPRKKLAMKGMLTTLLGIQQARLRGHVRV